MEGIACLFYVHICVCVSVCVCVYACDCLCLHDWNGGGKAWHGHIVANQK